MFHKASVEIREHHRRKLEGCVGCKNEGLQGGGQIKALAGLVDRGVNKKEYCSGR